jgi:hypothetical protein
MRNSVYKGLEVLAGYLNEDIDVNTITTIEEDEIDFNKKDIFPMANIRLTGANFDNQTMNFEVTYLDIRDVVKTVITDKYNGNDNRWDNINQGHSVLNSLVTKLKLRHNQYDIELVSTSEPVMFLGAFNNMLDGYSLIITLSYPNNKNNECEEC